MNPTSLPAMAQYPVSPFELANPDAYEAWREDKLARYPDSLEELVVEIRDSRKLDGAELDALHRALGRANFAVYRLSGANGDKGFILELGKLLGLKRLDGNLCSDDDNISSIRVVEERSVGEYIPYTNKALNWHTDGYYNTAQQQIRGVVLHCAQPAAKGGENSLLDHEIAYIRLRDENPDYIAALMAPDAMAIPPNIHNGEEIRALQSGPVFSVDADGFLHMRYSARSRNIIWKQNSTTQEAAECLLNLFHSDSRYIFRHRLKAGEGVVTNNVLHARAAFKDEAGQRRLLYRARYFDRVTDIRNSAHAESE
jgi:alpha-ketoglutarate-dependent taurine dioxygenase